MSDTGDFWFHYSQLPYQYPLMDQPVQPVIKIPVAGPEPFNTLAVVRFSVGIGQFAWADGKLHGLQSVVGTPFILERGDDADGPPPAQHSTTAALNHIQQSAGHDVWSGDSPFLHAVNAITLGEFRFDGRDWRWCVGYDHAWLADQAYHAATIHISSWVLCTEPRRDDRPPRGLGEQIWQPYTPWTTHVLHGAPSVKVLDAPGQRPRVERGRDRRDPPVREAPGPG